MLLLQAYEWDLLAWTCTLIASQYVVIIMFLLDSSDDISVFKIKMFVAEDC